MSKLEKQVQSRAEGSSKIIYFGQNHDYDDLVKCLLGKFYTPPGMIHCVTDEYDEHTVMLEIREEVDFILCGNGESVFSCIHRLPNMGALERISSNGNSR